MDRQTIKRNMILFRMMKYGKAGGFYSQTCYCDYCGVAPGREMHEIYSRGRTEKNEQERELSYQEELCSILCNKCHERHAHTPEGRSVLIRRNVETYGQQRVQQAASRLSSPDYILQHIDD